jgi:hypothetical protein
MLGTNDEGGYLGRVLGSRMKCRVPAVGACERLWVVATALAKAAHVVTPCCQTSVA